MGLVGIFCFQFGLFVGEGRLFVVRCLGFVGICYSYVVRTVFFVSVIFVGYVCFNLYLVTVFVVLGGVGFIVLGMLIRQYGELQRKFGLFWLFDGFGGELRLFCGWGYSYYYYDVDDCLCGVAAMAFTGY